MPINYLSFIDLLFTEAPGELLPCSDSGGPPRRPAVDRIGILHALPASGRRPGPLGPVCGAARAGVRGRSGSDLHW